jgi:hypothetical protein
MAANQLARNFRDSRLDVSKQNEAQKNADMDGEPVLNRGGVVTFSEPPDHVGRSTSTDDDGDVHEKKNACWK